MGRGVDGGRRLRRASAFAGAGDGMVAVALPLLAVGLSRHPVAVAGVIAAQHLPWALLAAIGPQVIGLADQRTVLGSAATLRAATAAVLGLLALAGAERMSVVVAGALVLGLGEALGDGAEDMVSSGAGPGAGLYRSGMTGLAAVGLPLGGLLFALAAGLPFLLAMGLFAVAALAALTLPRRLVGARPEVGRPTGDIAAPAGATAALTGVAALAAAAGGAVLGLLVLFAVDDLGLGAPAFGLVSSGLAAAAALGALVAPTVGSVFGWRGGSALALASSGAAYAGAAALADPNRAYLAVVALAAGAGAGMVAAVLLRAGLHLAVGAASPTSALAAFHLRVWAAVPAGALAGGVVAAASSVRTALSIAGLVSVVAAVAVGGLRSALRRPALEKSG